VLAAAAAAFVLLVLPLLLLLLLLGTVCTQIASLAYHRLQARLVRHLQLLV
jgi:hypothetical protein